MTERVAHALRTSMCQSGAQSYECMERNGQVHDEVVSDSL